MRLSMRMSRCLIERLLLPRRESVVSIPEERTRKRWGLKDNLKDREGESARKVFEQIMGQAVASVTIQDILAISPVMQQKMFRTQAVKELTAKPKVRSLDTIGPSNSSISWKPIVYYIFTPRGSLARKNGEGDRLIGFWSGY